MNDQDKSLKDKAVNIKGKSYVQVSDRIIFFNGLYENGRIQTELLTPPESQLIVMKSTVTPDVDKPERSFTGWSQEKVGDGMVNKTSALENAETSAVGRALGMLGIGVIESIASVDEINKAKNNESHTLKTPAKTTSDVKCKDCGAGTKTSSNTGKPYCEKLCWKNTQPKEQPQEDINIDEITF